MEQMDGTFQIFLLTTTLEKNPQRGKYQNHNIKDITVKQKSFEGSETLLVYMCGKCLGASDYEAVGTTGNFTLSVKRHRH